MVYKRDANYTESRSRIIWGDSKAEVESWLKDQGIDQFEIDAIIKDCMAERANEIRTEGMKKSAKWTLALVGFVILHVVFWYGLGFTTNKVLAICIIGSLVSGYKALDGILKFFFAGRTRGSITEME
jgi:hypothetical protein